jgi:hypothetical protein
MGDSAGAMLAPGKPAGVRVLTMMGACCDDRLKESKFATGDGMGRLWVVNWHEVRVDL